MVIDRRTMMIGAATWAALGTTASAAPDGSETQIEAPTERVLGIGGFFFRSRDPKALAQWYELHLGIDPVPTKYGQKAWEQTAGPTAFSPFPMDTDYFEAPQAFMLNFRVRNMDAMVAQLQKADIDVKVDPKTYPNGRFAWLHDPDGNKIELWQPEGPG
jgi:predicted enzyme related to lactoylglutathione lyase